VFCFWKSADLDEIIVTSISEVIREVCRDCDDGVIEIRAIPSPHQTYTISIARASPGATIAGIDAIRFTINMRCAILVQPHQMMVIGPFPQVNARGVALALLQDVSSTLSGAARRISHTEDLNISCRTKP
jgi:hypothetical protein